MASGMNAEAQAKALKKRKDVYAPKSSSPSGPLARPKKSTGATDATRQSDFVKQQEANSAKLASAAQKRSSSSGGSAAAATKPRPAASTTTTSTPAKTTTTTSVKSKSSPVKTKSLALKTSTPPKPRPTPVKTPAKTGLAAAWENNKGNNERLAKKRVKASGNK